MKRRNFIKTSVSAGLTLGLSTIPVFNIIGRTKKFQDDIKYDLIAIKGGEPDFMFREAIRNFGGMSSFVKPNQTVVIKPNIGWDAGPERAANTNPKLIAEIIKHSLEAGAKDVYVFDHTCDEWTRCYNNSGIKSASEDAGAKVVPGNSERYYHTVNIPGGKSLTDAKVHELILESDVFIDVPVIKHHGGAQVSLGMKNLMGIVWDRGYWHRNGLHQCIADFISFKKPDLTVIDGFNVMKRNGPRGVSVDDVVTMKTQILCKDIVAGDAAATKIFGGNPENIDHIKIAHEMGLGTMDLKNLSINRLKV